MSEVKERNVVETEISCTKSTSVELDGLPITGKKSNLEENSKELNLDCLLKIFEYLPLLDRIRVARVNKKWHEASRLSLSSLKSWEIRYIGSRISFIEVKTNLSIEVDCKNRAFEELLLRFGEFVLNLDASGVELYNLLIIFIMCRNIEKADFAHISIEKVRLPLWTLNKLTDLRFYELSAEEDDDYLEFFLSRLRLRSFHIRWAEELGGKFLKSLSPDIECLTLEYCELYNIDSALNIFDNFKNLRSLSLAGTLSDYIDIEIFIDLFKKLNLEKLNISENLDVVDDDFLIELAKHANGLIELDTSSNNVTDKGLNAITNLSHMEVLIIQDLGNNLKEEVDVNLPNLKCLRCRGTNLSEKQLIKFLNTSDKIEYLEPGKISEEFILSAVNITQNRKSKIPLKISINTKDEKILEIVNKIPKEHTRLLKFI